MPDSGESPVQQVRAAIAEGRPPARKLFERALREAFGMSARAAKKVAANGIRAGATDEAADVADLADRLRALEKSIRV